MSSGLKKVVQAVRDKASVGELVALARRPDKEIKLRILPLLLLGGAPRHKDILSVSGMYTLVCAFRAPHFAANLPSFFSTANRLVQIDL